MNSPSYSERLFPAIGTQLALALSIPMTFLAALPFSQTTAVVAALMAGAIVLGLGNALAPKISVTHVLQAGRFRVPLDAIGELKVLDADELKRRIGPEANPKAQLLIRGDLKSALEIEIVDPSDPTPYLVISSRTPQALASAIYANRT